MKKLITLLLLAATGVVTAGTAGNVQQLTNPATTFLSNLKRDLPAEIREEIKNMSDRYLQHSEITKQNLKIATKAYMMGVHDALMQIGNYLNAGMTAMGSIVKELETTAKTQMQTMNTQQTPPPTTNQTQMANAIAMQR